MDITKLTRDDFLDSVSGYLDVDDVDTWDEEDLESYFQWKYGVASSASPSVTGGEIRMLQHMPIRLIRY